MTDYNGMEYPRALYKPSVPPSLGGEWIIRRVENADECRIAVEREDWSLVPVLIDPSAVTDAPSASAEVSSAQAVTSDSSSDRVPEAPAPRRGRRPRG